MNDGFILNLILVLIPLALCFDKKEKVFKDWQALVPTVLFTGILGVIVKLTFANYKLVSYDAVLTAGIFFFELPLEAVLFCFSVPFLGLVGYNYLNQRFPNKSLEIYNLALSHVLMGLCIAVLFFAYNSVYAVLTFGSLLLLLLYIEYVNKFRFMYRFYRLYVSFVVGYALSQLLFSGIILSKYNLLQTLQFNLVAVPFENYFLRCGTLLCAVYLFELFKRRNHGIA